MDNPQLQLPSEEYKDSFLEALAEYQYTPLEESVDRLDLYNLKVDYLQQDFGTFVAKLRSQAHGENLPEGYVPMTQYWLIDNGEFVGRVDIRHRLTDFLLREGGHIGYDIRPSKRNQGYGKKILELALPKTKELGIEKALITCDDTNIGSQKIIKANNGILENIVPVGEGKPGKMRFWIVL